MSKQRGEKESIRPEELAKRLYVRVQEFADLTGTPIPSVYKYLASGELPSVRIGSTIRIPVKVLLDQLRGRQ